MEIVASSAAGEGSFPRSTDSAQGTVYLCHVCSGERLTKFPPHCTSTAEVMEMKSRTVISCFDQAVLMGDPQATGLWGVPSHQKYAGCCLKHNVAVRRNARDRHDPARLSHYHQLTNMPLCVVDHKKRSLQSKGQNESRC